MIIKREANFITKELMPWLRNNLPLCLLGEAKYVTIKEKSYNYKSDKSLQKEITNLKIAGRTFVYKFPDSSGNFQGTPTDIVKLVSSNGYFFFKFESLKDRFFYIQVETLEKEILAGNKSLTPIRANEIGITVITKPHKPAVRIKN